ncbi:unnamed protein product [Acanthosepion pharaonis]|uniref:Uncharacterized protein n=1 Tax=Acanthosepion pharaonis TaxID=158019 RepID=A0A812DNW6_ACAPH|nr:unnamed protein product [Sepia pharaonis]
MTLQKQREAEQKLSQFVKLTPVTPPSSMNPLSSGGGVVGGAPTGCNMPMTTAVPHATAPSAPPPLPLPQQQHRQQHPIQQQQQQQQQQQVNSQAPAPQYASDVDTAGNTTESSRPVTPGSDTSLPPFPLVTDGSYSSPTQLDNILLSSLWTLSTWHIHLKMTGKWTDQNIIKFNKKE